MKPDGLKDSFKKFKKYIMNAICETDQKAYLYKEAENFRKWLHEDNLDIVVGDFDVTINEMIMGAYFFIQPEIEKEYIEYLDKFYKDELGYRTWKSTHITKVNDHVVIEFFTLLTNKYEAIRNLDRGF